MANFLKSLLYSKEIDSEGNVISRKPMFFKTLADLVFLNDGTTLESKVGSMQSELDESIVGIDESGVSPISEKTKDIGIDAAKLDGCTLEDVLSMAVDAVDPDKQDTFLKQVSGNVIHVKDSVEGDLVITSAPRNLVPYPFHETTKTVNGITFTDHRDGSISASGTSTDETAFVFMSDLHKKLEHGKDYFIYSSIPYDNTTNNVNIVSFKNNNEDTEWFTSDGNPFRIPTNVNSCELVLWIPANTTVNIEKEFIAIYDVPNVNRFLPYSGYVVYSYGKNLLPFDLNAMMLNNTNGTWEDNTFLKDGITYTVNEDGSISVSGTATKRTAFIIAKTPFIGDNIVFSGAVGGTSNTYRLEYTNNVDTSVSNFNEPVAITSYDYNTYPYSSIQILIMDGATVNTAIRPMIRLATDDESFEKTTVTSVFINQYTEFPVYGLKSHENVTNVISGDSIDIIYPLTKVGASILQNNISCNINALDNPWFMISQRGQRTISVADDFVADRWRLDTNVSGKNLIVYDGKTVTITKNEGYVGIKQIMYPDIFNEGENVTVSVRYSDGTIEYGVFKWLDNSGGKVLGRTIVYSILGIPISIRTNRKTISIDAVKLERGTISTLDKDIIPNYQEEVMRCATSSADVNDTLASKPNYAALINRISKWENITLPTPTVDNNIRTYSINLSGYSCVEFDVYVTNCGVLNRLTVTPNNSEQSLYVIDNNGCTWSGKVTVDQDKIVVKTNSNSTSPDVNYLVIQRLQGKKSLV